MVRRREVKGTFGPCLFHFSKIPTFHLSIKGMIRAFIVNIVENIVKLYLSQEK